MMEVLDKGKAAAVTVIVETKDKHTGKVIFENQSTVFIRGSGGFGGKRTGKGECKYKFQESSLTDRTALSVDRGPATAANKPPPRSPDAVAEEKTLPSQAAIYR